MSADEAQVRLYAWMPNEHGRDSYIVAAHSEREARAAVLKYMEDNDELFDYHSINVASEDYELHVLPIGEVMAHSNS